MLGLAAVPMDQGRVRVQCWATANDFSIRHTLEAAGVDFIDENGGGAGPPSKGEGFSFIAEPEGGFGVRLGKKPQASQF
jgi:hypothetical protein